MRAPDAEAWRAGHGQGLSTGLLLYYTLQYSHGDTYREVG